MKRVFLTAASLFVLCGCMSSLLIPAHTPEITYKEEVLLHDGRIIVVERHAERKGRAVPGSAPMQSWEEIRTKNPDTGEEVVWQEDAASGPRVLDFVNGTAYLAANVDLHSACSKYGYPRLNFIFFKYESGWKRISYEEFPKSIDTNLFLGDWHAERVGMLSQFMTINKKAAYYKKHTYGAILSLKENMEKVKRSSCARFSNMIDYPREEN